MINVTCLNHPETISSLTSAPVCGKSVFHETSPWCQKVGHRCPSSLLASAAWDIVMLKHDLFFTWNSNVTGHPIFSFATSGNLTSFPEEQGLQGLPPVTETTTDPGLQPRTPGDHFLLPRHHTVSHVKSSSNSLELTNGEKMNILHNTKGFPGGSDCKEATCSAGVLGSIPGLGRSPEVSIATHSRILA